MDFGASLHEVENLADVQFHWELTEFSIYIANTTPFYIS